MKKLTLFVLSIFTAFLAGCTSHSEKKSQNFYQLQTKPKQVASFQIQDKNELVGYVHKYEWDASLEKKMHCYFVYDKRKKYIGYINHQGSTDRYFGPNDKRNLGSFDLEQALAALTDKPSVQVYHTQNDIVPYKEVKKIEVNRTSTGKARRGPLIRLDDDDDKDDDDGFEEDNLDSEFESDEDNDGEDSDNIFGIEDDEELEEDDEENIFGIE